ncbi:MAG: class I SAM-dependent methyltransferase [Desulfobacteraceae bacterium]|nr:MAG: class I SAM-dependent methyltransferase [Desulfobacteraceae bacterium]
MSKLLRNRLYRFFIHDATFYCYDNCLNYFPPQSVVLDVGIGNCTMIQDFHPLISDKKLQIHGIDINRHYLSQCGDMIHRFHLENQIHIYHEAVEQFRPPARCAYDFILFSMSFMLFQNQQAVLNRVLKWLKPGGRLVFFQTMFLNHSRFLDFLKPKLVYLTTVNFGTVVYEDQFKDFLRQNELRVIEDKMIKKEWYRGEYRMIVASPSRAMMPGTAKAVSVQPSAPEIQEEPRSGGRVP